MQHIAHSPRNEGQEGGMSELLADYLDKERSRKEHIREPERAQVELGVSEHVIAESRIPACAVTDRAL